MEIKTREKYDKYFKYNDKNNCIICSNKIFDNNKLLYETQK